MKQHAYVSIVIPTNQSFLKDQYAWTHGKVARHFKRDKERVFDTAQNVRVRLLSKDFIGRWFFKHLTDELVDRAQAERMLGGVAITFVGQLPTADIPNASCQNPACARRRARDLGCVRSCPQSLWRVRDILAFAKFDHERYYYSIQGHTIDSAKVLKLLGYPEDQYTLLQSMYRQNRLRPAELTEHDCSGGKCVECDHGRSLLAQRRLSLAHNWGDPAVAQAAAKLRWNDRQLRPFLREWRRTNMVRTTPLYVMRTDKKLDVNAGLYKYAETVIDNEVVNDFKRMSRADDMHAMVFNNGQSPEHSDSDTVAWESDDSTEDGKVRVLRDTSSLTKFSEAEDRHDLERLTGACDLSDEETSVIAQVDLGEMSVREFADQVGKPIQKVHRVRQSALRKLRSGELESDMFRAVSRRTAERHGCSLAEMLSPAVSFGPAVVARADFFSALYDSGMGIAEIAVQYGFSEERVAAAINRACIRESRPAPGPRPMVAE